MIEDIKKILDVSVNAPSGSNSQPWSFKINGNKLYVYAHPEKDHPILNFHNRGTWIAHGALIENIIIVSRAHGYRTKITIFPDHNLNNLTAQIEFEKSEVINEPLYPAVSLRATNRKFYDQTPLTQNQKQEFLKTIAEIGERVTFKLIEEPDQLKVLGRAVSVNEIVMFENKKLHHLFVKELVWNEKELSKRADGLYVKTMELKPPQEKALRLFKFWPVMSLLNKVGVARAVAKDNAKNYASCAAMGLITVDNKDGAFINAGRLIERLWLKATTMGLSFHLITGIFFFWQRMQIDGSNIFSPKHIKMIQEAYKSVVDIYGIANNEIIAGLVRIGRGGEPTARSPKKPPVIESNN